MALGAHPFLWDLNELERFGSNALRNPEMTGIHLYTLNKLGETRFRSHWPGRVRRKAILAITLETVRLVIEGGKPDDSEGAPSCTRAFAAPAISAAVLLLADEVEVGGPRWKTVCLCRSARAARQGCPDH